MLVYGDSFGACNEDHGDSNVKKNAPLFPLIPTAVFYIEWILIKMYLNFSSSFSSAAFTLRNITRTSNVHVQKHLSETAIVESKNTHSLIIALSILSFSRKEKISLFLFLCTDEEEEEEDGVREEVKLSSLFYSEN